MKFTPLQSVSTLLAALLASKTVAGHTVFTTLFVNDTNQGDGTCVRMPMTPNNATFPVNDLSSNDMACGFDGTKGIARVCPVNESAKLSFLFREYPDASQPGALDPSHKGPCAVYMKSVTSAINNTATGDGWFKIWDEGYDSNTSQWCTEKLMQNNGFLSVKIPSDLAGGYYLVRPELLALHQADKTPPNPQFYVGCAQIFLSSNKTASPLETVSIPGYTNITDPSVLFNIYTSTGVKLYTPPGPAAYISSLSSSSQVKPISVQTEGLLPPNTVITNANWYATELSPYFTAEACTNASQTCFDQTATCYATAPPTGDQGCRIWEERCDAIQLACNEGTFTGPPDAGKVLSPAVQVYENIPAAQGNETVVVVKSTIAASSSSAIPTTLLKLPSALPTALSDLASPSGTTRSGYIFALPPSSASIPYTGILPTQTTPPPTGPQPSPTNPLPVSEDGDCGPEAMITCLGSEFGDCCSSHGYCGSTESYCGVGNCQSGFGSCAVEGGNGTSVGTGYMGM